MIAPNDLAERTWEEGRRRTVRRTALAEHSETEQDE
jgi:hypothetical protein